eukprot:evm.model.scf_1386.2 EVM.evm.TU.scf_1386.2   scf_1386:10522-11582(+)
MKGFDGSLGGDTVKDQLRDLFADCGNMQEIRTPKDYETQELRGIGFVVFALQDGKNTALELNGTKAVGGYLKIDDPMAPSGAGARGRGGNDSSGRFGGRGGGHG